MWQCIRLTLFLAQKISCHLKGTCDIPCTLSYYDICDKEQRIYDLMCCLKKGTILLKSKSLDVLYIQLKKFILLHGKKVIYQVM